MCFSCLRACKNDEGNFQNVDSWAPAERLRFGEEPHNLPSSWEAPGLTFEAVWGYVHFLVSVNTEGGGPVHR